jgi:hypothetical protein
MPTFTYLPLTPLGINRNNTLPRTTQVRERTAQGVASPAFSAGLKEGRGRSEYYMPWDKNNANIPQALKDFVGYSETAYDLNNKPKGILRHIPYPNPTKPNYLYCDYVNIEPDVPLGADVNGVARYDEAKISATFSTRDYVILNDSIFAEETLKQYVKITVDPVGRYERLPSEGAGLKWWIDQRPVSNARTMTFIEGEVTVYWYQVPVEAIPWSAISQCVGCCDAPIDPAAAVPSYDFLSSSYLGPILQIPLNPPTAAFLFNTAVPFARFAPSFVCLTPKISDPYPMVSGNASGGSSYASDIAFKFKFFPFGANSFFRWEVGQFQFALSNRAPNNADRIPGFYRPARLQSLFWGF